MTSSERTLIQGDESLADTNGLMLPTNAGKKEDDEARLPLRCAFEEGRLDKTNIERVLNRFQTIVIFITNEVGLGVLSLPHALHTLGLVPGVVAIIGLGILTGWTANVLKLFYEVHPEIVNIADCGYIIGGKWFGHFIGLVFITNLSLISASASLTMSIALNTITSHALCTVAFIAFPTIACWLLCIPRSMGFVAKMGYPSTVSIIAAVTIVMVAIGVKGPQGASPGFEKDIVLFGKPTFTEGMVACLNIAFAFAGNQGFVTVMAEMKSPSRDFTPAICYLQGFAIIIYTIVAVVIYALSGQHIHNPALGSAPRIVAKIAYGVVFPCLLGTGLVFGHTANKFMHVLCMRKMGAAAEISANTRRAWVTWIANNTAFWVVAFLLANAIPVFGSILSIASAIFVSWFTFGISGIIWLNLHWKKQWQNKKKMSLSFLAWACIAVALIMNTAGMYAAMEELLIIFQAPESRINGPFTCGDNGLF